MLRNKLGLRDASALEHVERALVTQRISGRRVSASRIRAIHRHLRLLAEHAGRPVDLARIDGRRWLRASQASFRADYGPMTAEILRMLAASA